VRDDHPVAGPETFQELAHPGLLDGGHRWIHGIDVRDAGQTGAGIIRLLSRLERLGVPQVALPPAIDVNACPTGRGYQPRLGLADLAI